MNRINVHELKCLNEFFIELDKGTKTFEIRKNDRDYQVGDILSIRRVVSTTSPASGKSIHFRVTYVLKNYGLLFGYVCMGIQRLSSYQA